MKYLLDTNVISELISKQPNPQVMQWIDSLDQTAVYLSVIAVGELQKGIEKLSDSKRKETLHRWLNDDLLARFSGHMFVLDVPVTLTWGALVGLLERMGRPLAALDSLIAALALHHHCSLVTRNESDFKDTGVTIINPWPL